MKRKTLYSAFLAVALPSICFAWDEPVFTQDVFGNYTSLTNQGWTTKTAHIAGRIDPDGQSALILGWSSYVEWAQISTGISTQKNRQYYFQFDVRMTQTFGATNSDTWVNNDPDDRPLTYKFLDGDGNILSSETYSINAATSTSQWVTVRSEYSAAFLGAGEQLKIRFDKLSWGGAQEAIWVDNIEVGETDRPGTTLIVY